MVSVTYAQCRDKTVMKSVVILDVVLLIVVVPRFNVSIVV
jgi:hypothetical protein